MGNRRGGGRQNLTGNLLASQCLKSRKRGVAGKKMVPAIGLLLYQQGRNLTKFLQGIKDRSVNWSTVENAD